MILVVIKTSTDKGGIDIKVVSAGTADSNQVIQKIRFSVVNEKAQKAALQRGSEMMGSLFSSIAKLDPNYRDPAQLEPQNKPFKRRYRAGRS